MYYRQWNLDQAKFSEDKDMVEDSDVAASQDRSLQHKNSMLSEPEYLEVYLMSKHSTSTSLYSKSEMLISVFKLLYVSSL